MNAKPTVCPNCGAVVLFVPAGSWSRCPECGGAYGGDSAPSGDSNPMMSVIKVICWVMIVMMAIVGVGVAVMFVGCLAAISKF
ncbi:MAG: hypothetical protein EXS35_04825 [Pedosphaera sp.]|nr:hypothetical protein [Pedosphaera sp.]